MFICPLEMTSLLHLINLFFFASQKKKKKRVSLFCSLYFVLFCTVAMSFENTMDSFLGW